MWMAWEYCVAYYGRAHELLIELFPYTLTPGLTATASVIAKRLPTQLRGPEEKPRTGWRGREEEGERRDEC